MKYTSFDPMSSSVSAVSAQGRVPFFVLTDSLSSRVLFSAGIVSRLYEGLEGNIEILTTFDLDQHVDHAKWPVHGRTVPITDIRPLMRTENLSRRYRWRKVLDAKLEQRIGFYPAAVRHSLIHGFSLERMKWFNSKPFLNKSLAWPFPRSKWILDRMIAWMYGPGRFIHPDLLQYMESRCAALILGNLQLHSAQPLVLCAERLGVPVVGHIGSWDHPVGKGVVYPRCRRYIVQNDYMLNALVDYHRIDPERITVTGWPQLDVCARPRMRSEFDSLIEAYGLDPAKPTVMYCGNSESNAPYEVEYLKRFVEWWESNARGDFNVLLRPHPRYIINDRWKTVYAWLDGKQGIYLQPPSYDDIEELALLLQHMAVFMTNAGTILLDSIVNACPVVCVLYDEGAPAGSRYAINNVVGDHYKQLMASGAFYEAYSFEESLQKLKRALENPRELDDARRRIAEEIVGEVDGLAGERVAAAILETVAEEAQGGA